MNKDQKEFFSIGELSRSMREGCPRYSNDFDIHERFYDE
jgi:hypothetical protein